MGMKAWEGEFLKDSRKRQKFIKKENGGGQREERGKALSRSDRPNAGLTGIPAAPCRSLALSPILTAGSAFNRIPGFSFALTSMKKRSHFT
jgi:hypothetical protein